MPAKYVWGDCMKPGRYSYRANGKKRRGAFTWDDNSCDDFDLRKTVLKTLRDDSARDERDDENLNKDTVNP